MTILKRVLLIDDNRDFAALLEVFLKNDRNWQFISAFSGREGIAKAKVKQPDVILLDIAMPELDGLEVYRILKSRSITAQIPIIFISAIAQTREIVDREFSPDVQVILKPLNIFELPDYMNKACDRSKICQKT